ncbi:glycosyltransferase family 39 protein [Kallotenue papyrolyticum]|uniref:glycosyltransferase family 39 protein n=1 Tax=Kallotenue papyrolyticum TaxID=1325125 RepID=UPI0004B08A33|nr:glycosyltransferase family 39 protein [Kallotenue papyrolyticum]
MQDLGNRKRSLVQKSLNQPYFIATLLFVSALTIRLYRLTANPLWLDELYGYQLSQLGVGAIFRNTLYVPHPPLYYLLLHVTSGWGAFHDEWAWRWFSAIIGAASVPLLYYLAKSLSTKSAAFLSSLLLMVSPTHIYYSQEARPYAFLICLAIITSLLVIKIRKQPKKRELWIGFTALSLWGILSGYSFIMVVGTQLLYFAIVVRNWRYLFMCGGTIILCCLLLAGPAIRTLGETHAAYANSKAITVTLLAQAVLVGDPLRYGLFWAHTWVPLSLSLIMLIGLAHALWLWREQEALYHGMQVMLPLVAFFVVATPILHITLPEFEWRQFLVLVPSFYVLLAIGFAQIWQQRRMGKVITIAVCVLAIGASARSLQQYWNITKSPEGLAALFVRDHQEENDAIVSLHYSVDAALSFYLPNKEVFAKPDINGQEIRFARSSSILPEVQDKIVYDATAVTIRRYPRVWIIFHAPTNTDMVNVLTEDCMIVNAQEFSPFRVLIVDQCR